MYLQNHVTLGITAPSAISLGHAEEMFFTERELRLTQSNGSVGFEETDMQPSMGGGDGLYCLEVARGC